MPEFEALGAQVYGVSVDSTWAHTAWREQLQLPNGLVLLSDFNRELGNAYGLTHTSRAGMRDVLQRTVFVIASDGRIAYRWLPSEGSGMPNPDDVLDAVRRLTRPSSV